MLAINAKRKQSLSDNNMDAPSKQGLKERWRTRQCIPSEFKRFSGGACPRTPLEFFSSSRTRNKGHFSLLRNLQQISHSDLCTLWDLRGLIIYCLNCAEMLSSSLLISQRKKMRRCRY